jgi:hypothetical protein
MAGKRAVVAERISAQGLSGEPLRDVAAVPELLLAVQGQDPRGARLAVRSRTAGLTAADVDRAFTEERSILITWLNRGTLHLIRGEDYPLLQSLTTTPLFTSANRRLRQEGVTEAKTERALKTVARTLGEEGPLSGKELKERVERAEGQVVGRSFIHLMFLAAIEGILVRGPMRGKQHAYALVEDWLGPWRAPDRDAALAELARRYLAGHGPAGDRDLARWSGLPLRDARAGLAAIELVERDGLVDLPGRGDDPAPGSPPSPPSWSSARTASSTSPAASARPSCRRPACWAPTSRCCSAGPRARRSSARTSSWSATTASSARSPSPAAGPSRPGATPAAR